MRRARHVSQDSAFYHITTRVAGLPDYFPLKDRPAARRLRRMIFQYTRAFCCRLAAFSIMDNHYHFIVFMEKFRFLGRPELERRARLFYGHRYEPATRSWNDLRWQQFNRKLFEVSDLMQMINGEYGKWFNRRSGRRGHLWGDRFSNPQLLDRLCNRFSVISFRAFRRRCLQLSPLGQVQILLIGDPFVVDFDQYGRN